MTLTVFIYFLRKLSENCYIILIVKEVREMNLDILQTNLILVFETGKDEYNEPIYTKVTISKLRNDLTPSEIDQVATAFASLVSYSLFEVNVVYTNRLYKTA